MKELFRTANPVQISIMQKILDDHAIETVVMDQNTASIFPGVGAMEARLMVVEDDDYDEALAILKDEGLIS